ncbi:hypothetical protein HRG_008255 [Hirsutella rhossiliensis]|uniref:Uncharacterized protein n=1 Tax=Hirsutella rhossiliensis TaxID=111463 RepID=A0A9P8MU42_9HYPO|nr:uncharacterized protein HRG_08255 [Hirsutella rhossiliensis]KAH0961102.1 hypothetical protein HRG_08255 [Hirsutella rhossiliensis]
MGFFSFLTRRRALDRAAAKPPPATAAEPPPIQGARPKTSGPSHSSENPKHASTRKASQSRIASPAKPFFLGIRNDDAHPRQQQPPPSSDPKPRHGVRSFRSPPVSKTAHATRGQPTEADAQLLASWKRSSAAYSIASVPAGYAYPRTSRHIDLLEAQSVIRPYDFKSRVLAVGTRDYGEDVADRNLGHNAADLTIPAVQTYYASLAGPPSVFRPRDDLASASRHRPLSVVALSALAQPQDHAASSRRHRQYSSVPAATPDGPEAEERQPRASRTKNLDPTPLLPRPNSIAGYPVPARGRRVRAGTGGSLKRRARRGPSLERTPTPHSSKASQNRKPAGQAREKHRESDGPQAAERSRPRSRPASPPHVPRYRPRETQPPPPVTRAHKARKNHRSRSHGEDARTRAHTPRPAPRQAVRSLDKPMEPKIPVHDIFFDTGRADERASQIPSRWPDSSSEEDMNDWAPAPLIPSRRDQGWPMPTLASPGTHAPWQSPWSHAHRDALRSRGAAASLSRDGSCKSGTSVQALTMDIAGYVPDRKSSLKHWSFSSITPTTELSDHSSTLAVRPRSIHTANTSIDLPPLASPANLPELKESPSSIGSQSRPVSSPYLTALENMDTNTTVATQPEAAAGFDEDHPEGEQDGMAAEMTGYGNDTDANYSYVNSFAARRRPQHRQDDESMLLKRGGYIDLGNNLPGLFDTAATSPCLMCSLLESAAIGPASDDKGTEPWAPRAPCNHKGLNSPRERLRALGYEYDTDDSESGPERASRGRTRTLEQTREPNAAGKRQRETWETIEEEAEEDCDSQMAVPKLQGGSGTRIEELSGSRGFEPVLKDYEEGHAADVE